jgi:hypothetical protein
VIGLLIATSADPGLSDHWWFWPALVLALLLTALGIWALLASLGVSVWWPRLGGGEGRTGVHQTERAQTFMRDQSRIEGPDVGVRSEDDARLTLEDDAEIR